MPSLGETFKGASLPQKIPQLDAAFVRLIAMNFFGLGSAKQLIPHIWEFLTKKDYSEEEIRGILELAKKIRVRGI